MKHLVWAAAAGTLLASSAFADFSIKTQGRIEADVFTYSSPSRNTRPSHKDNGSVDKYDNGDMLWAKDTKHNDDVSLEAKGGDSGAKIVFAIKSKYDNSDSEGTPGLSMTSYQIWTNLFGIRLDAGAYDQRLAKNLNNDGDFATNLSANKKPGLWVPFDGADWGLDAANITALKGKKNVTNFQVSKSGLLDNKLTVRGVLFLSKSGTDINGDNHGSGLTNNEKWIFTPFALGGLYKLDKNTEIGFNVKLNSIKHDASCGSDKADNSVWTLNGNIYKKLASGMEVEAHYTLGASLYSNWSGHGAYTKKQVQTVKDVNGLVRDFDVFAHGVDFHVKKGLSDALSMTLVTNLTYVQSTEIERRANRQFSNGGSDKKTYFKDSRAKSYYMGAAGKLAYYAALSVDYKQSDMITYQLQTNIEDDNVFEAAGVKKVGDYNYYGIDYYNNMKWRIRPAVIIKPDSYATISAGVLFELSGFHQNATGSKNTFKTTVTVPVGLRVKI